MRADIGGGGPAIAHLPCRKARAHLFSGSGRGAIIAILAAGALMIGLGVAAGHADSGPAALTPFAYIR